MRLKHAMALAAAGSFLFSEPTLFRTTAAETIFVDKIIAVVQDRVITHSMIMRHTAEIEAELARRLPESEFRARAEALRQEALEQLINHKLLKAEIDEREYQLPEAAVDQRINQIVRLEAGVDRSEFEDMLLADGLTWPEFREQIKLQILIESLLEDEVRSHHHVSAAEAKRFYEENREEFIRPERILAQRIFICRETRSPEAFHQVVENLRRRLQLGDDFELMGLDVSDDEQALDSTWLTVEDLPQPMAAMTQHLPLDTVSPPINAQEGVWLVKIQEKQGERLQDFAQVQETIMDVLSQRREQERYEQLIAFLRRKFYVRRYE